MLVKLNAPPVQVTFGLPAGYRIDLQKRVHSLMGPILHTMCLMRQVIALMSLLLPGFPQVPQANELGDAKGGVLFLDGAAAQIRRSAPRSVASSVDAAAVS